MSFSFTGGEYNASRSLNKFIKDNLNTTLPSWKTGAFTIYYDWPDAPAATPCFTVTHLGGFETVRTQGNSLGGTTRGQEVRRIAEVSCWVDSQDNDNWVRDLTQMRDMVVKLFSQTREVMVYDLYGGTSNPSTTGSMIRIVGVEDVDVPPDPNPNIRRRRLLVSYDYWQR